MLVKRLKERLEVNTFVSLDRAAARWKVMQIKSERLQPVLNLTAVRHYRAKFDKKPIVWEFPKLSYMDRRLDSRKSLSLQDEPPEHQEAT